MNIFHNWSEWAPFPDPRAKGILNAPFGPGVYELRRKDTGQLVLRGCSRNCAYRMTSLLRRPLGQGTRNNSEKQDYVLEYIDLIEYRTIACTAKDEAKKFEGELHGQAPCKFPT